MAKSKWESVQAKLLPTQFTIFMKFKIEKLKKEELVELMKRFMDQPQTTILYETNRSGVTLSNHKVRSFDLMLN